jgi:hypothetical protein
MRATLIKAQIKMHLTNIFRGIPAAALMGSVLLTAQQRPIVLKIGTALDGTGRTLHQTIIVVGLWWEDQTLRGSRDFQDARHR